MYEIIIDGADSVLLTAAQLLRLELQQNRCDGMHRTAGRIWFWAAWRSFRYVRGTIRRAA